MVESRSQRHPEGHYHRQGFGVDKVAINVKQMQEWCHQQGYEIDSNGRAAFGATLSMTRAVGEDVMTAPFRDNTRVVQ